MSIPCISPSVQENDGLNFFFLPIEQQTSDKEQPSAAEGGSEVRDETSVIRESEKTKEVGPTSKQGDSEVEKTKKKPSAEEQEKAFYEAAQERIIGLLGAILPRDSKVLSSTLLFSTRVRTHARTHARTYVG